MKLRNGFVSNSSSSSFLILTHSFDIRLYDPTVSTEESVKNANLYFISDTEIGGEGKEYFQVSKRFLDYYHSVKDTHSLCGTIFRQVHRINLDDDNPNLHFRTMKEFFMNDSVADVDKDIFLKVISNHVTDRHIHEYFERYR